MTTRKHDEDEHKAEEAKKAADAKAAAEKKHTSDTAPAAADPAHAPTKDPMATPTWPVHGPNPASEK
jgi:hypothetical protein